MVLIFFMVVIVWVRLIIISEVNLKSNKKAIKMYKGTYLFLSRRACVSHINTTYNWYTKHNASRAYYKSFIWLSEAIIDI